MLVAAAPVEDLADQRVIFQARTQLRILKIFHYFVYDLTGGVKGLLGHFLLLCLGVQPPQGKICLPELGGVANGPGDGQRLLKRIPGVVPLFV